MANPLEKLYNRIVPARIAQELRLAARVQTVSNFKIADLANETMAYVKKQKRQGKFKEVHEFQVWYAVARLCGKTAGRVRRIAKIGCAFPIEIRARYEYDFGYYEQAVVFDVSEREGALEFIAFFEKEYGRTLGIGEFPKLYRQNMLGENAITLETPPMPEGFDILLDEPEQEYAGENVFSRLSGWLKEIREKAFGKQDKPAVQRLLLGLEMVEESLPAAMEELGYVAKVREDVEV